MKERVVAKKIGETRQEWAVFVDGERRYGGGGSIGESALDRESAYRLVKQIRAKLGRGEQL